MAEFATMFLHLVLFFSNIETSYEEKVIGCFVMFIFYVFYVNSLVNFVKSFYNIIKNSKIDDCDLVIVDIWITFAFGTVLLIYGLVYFLIISNPTKKNFAITSLIVSGMIYFQCFLMRKFYLVAD